MLRYLIAAVILLVGMTAQAAAQDEAELRAGVVKIVSTLDGKRRTGTGFAVKARRHESLSHHGRACDRR